MSASGETLGVEGRYMSVWSLQNSQEPPDEDYEDMARILDRLKMAPCPARRLFPRISLSCSKHGAKNVSSAVVKGADPFRTKDTEMKQKKHRKFKARRKSDRRANTGYEDTSHLEDMSASVAANFSQDHNKHKRTFYHSAVTFDNGSHNNSPVVKSRGGLASCSQRGDESSEEADTGSTSSATESSDSENSDEESFRLSHVMRALAVYAQKPAQRREASFGALRNLIRSYAPRIGDPLPEAQCEQLLGMLDVGTCVDNGLREMSLFALRQLARLQDNAAMLIRQDALSRLLLVLELDTQREQHEGAALVLEQLVSHSALVGLWDDVIRQGGFSSLIAHVQPGQPLPVRLACACVLRNLAEHAFYAQAICEHALSAIMCFKTMNSEFQEVYFELVARLLLHADESTLQVLNTDALPSAVHMLQHGTCDVQRQALVLLGSLCSTETGMHAMLAERDTVPMILSAVLNSECRRVREQAVSVLSRMTSCTQAHAQKNLLLQVDEFHHQTDEKLEAAVAEEFCEKPPQLSEMDKMERGVSDLATDLMQILSKLGKFEHDVIGNTVDIHLAPCFDTDAADLLTICNVLKTLNNICSFRAASVKIPAFEQEHSAHKKLIRNLKDSLGINYNICQILIKNQVLSVVDLLSVYTQKLLDIISICSKPLQSMGGMSKAQLLFQAWGSQAELMGSAGTVNICSLFDANEIELVTHLLQMLTVLTSSTEPIGEHSESLEDKISEKIMLFNNKQVATNGPKVKKSKDMLFHSKEACELCRKGATHSHSVQESVTKHTKSQRLDANNTSDSSPNPEQIESAFRHALSRHIGTSQREMRAQMYEAGLIESVAPWLMSSASEHQTCVLSIMRSLVQPVMEQIAPSAPKQPKMQAMRTRLDPHQMNATERDQALNAALYQMSSRMKRFIQDALGWGDTQAHQNTPRNEAQNSPTAQTLAPRNIPPCSPSRNTSRHSSVTSEEMCYKWTDNAENALKVEERKRQRRERRLSSKSSDCWDGSSPNNTNREVPDHAYDKFARFNSQQQQQIPLFRRKSNVIPSPTPSTFVTKRPGSATPSATDSFKSTRAPSNRERRKSLSPRRQRRRPSANPVLTKPKTSNCEANKPAVEDEQNVVIPQERQLSIKESLERLTSSSSEVFLNATEVNASNFPAAVYDLKRSRAQMSISDEGHQCDDKARSRPLSRSSSSSSSISTLLDRRPSSAISMSDSECGASMPLGRRYPKRVWVPWRPLLSPTQGVAEQCRCLVAMVIGKVLLGQLFTRDTGFRKNVLDLMDQYIRHGQTESHMRLSAQGLMPRLVDFLRVNDHDHMLEMMGLSVVGQLLSSDGRLASAFDAHGGSQLLTAMSGYATGPLRQHVTETLHVLTTKTEKKKTKKSNLMSKVKRTPDIWDQIMVRWKQENKVVDEVLSKFNT